MFKTNNLFGSIETLRETGGVYVGESIFGDERAVWISSALEHFGYENLDRDDKGLVRKYIQDATGYSRAHIARFIAQHQSKKFTSHISRESLTLQRVRRGATGFALACIMLLLSRSGGAGSAADLITVLNSDYTEITRTALHEAALHDARERYILVSSIHELPNGETETYPLIAVNEKTVVLADGTQARETIVSSSPEAMWARVEERRLARLRLLKIAPTDSVHTAPTDRIVARPDILIEKEIFPLIPSTKHAAATGPWDLPPGGEEGQMIMIQNGKIVWRDFPYLEQIRSQDPHGSERTRRAGGNRSGGSGDASGNTSTTIIQQVSGGTTAPSGWTDGAGVVYLTESTDLVGIGTDSPSNKLEVVGSISGASLYITSSMSGAGLADCDATSSKLAYDATTGRFSCAIDQTVGTGLSQETGDARYVRKSGDTMTGALIINITGGNANTVGLNVINSISGAVIRAQKTLASSGSLVVEGSMSGASLYVASSINGAGLTDCDAANQTLNWDATSGRFSCGTDSDTTYTAGQNLSLNGTSFSLNTTITGALVRFNTVSGSLIYAKTTLASSGTLVVEGAMSGASLYVATSLRGAGLSDCDLSTQALKWDDTSGRFSCGAVSSNSFGSGNVLTIGDDRYVRTAGDTMTGALVIDITGGNANTVGLNVINTISGAVIRAQKTLASSGSLVWEGTASGNALRVMANSYFLGRVGFGTTSPNALVHVYADSTQTSLGASNVAQIQIENPNITDNTYAHLGFTTKDTFGTSIEAARIAAVFTDHTQGSVDSDLVFITSNAGSAAPAMRIMNSGRVGIGTSNPDTLLEVIGTVSGSSVYAKDALRSSGSLVWEGAASGASLFVGTSIRGAGLSDCDTGASSKLLWDSTTGRFSCGTDQTGGAGTPEVGTSSFSGGVLRLSDSRYVNVAGDTMTGGLMIQNGGTPGTIDANTLLEVVGVMSGSQLKIFNSTTGTGVYVHQTGNGTALDILSRSTTTDVFNINAPLLTTGIGLDINGANALTTGQLMRLISNSNSTAIRSLMSVINDHASASNTTVLKLQQDASGSGLFIDMNGNGVALDIDSEATTRPGLRIDMPTMNANQNPHILFGYRGTFDANIFRSGPNQITTSGSFVVAQSAFDAVWHDTDNDNSTGLTDYTSLAATTSGTPLTIFATENPSNDYFYVGSVKPFSIVTFVMATRASSLDLVGEYWNGSSWGTIGFDVNATNLTSPSGSIHFEPPGNWNATSLNAELMSKYYIRFHANGSNVTKGPTAYSVSPTQKDLFVVRGMKDDSEPVFYLNANRNIGINTSTPVTNAALSISGGVLIAPGFKNAIFHTSLALEVRGTMSGSRIYASTMLSTSGALVIESNNRTGSGAATIVAAEFQTGTYIFSSGATALALDSYTESGELAPAITFGKRGLFDTKLSRTGTGALTFASNTGILMTLESERSDATGNVFQIFSDVSSNENRVLRIQANGAVISDNAYSSGGADYAEWFFSTDKIKQGDVVCIDVTRKNAVKICANDADTNLMGIASTNPAFVGNVITGADGIMPPGYYLIGLIGQVPTKVVIENNEPIRPGDQLTAASIPGYARRARAGESTVGVALEGLEFGEGTVNVLISRRNQSLTVQAVEDKVLQTVANMEIEDEVEIMVAGALKDLNVDDQISAEVERQIAAINDQTQSMSDLRSEIDIMKGQIGSMLSQSGSVTRIESEESSGALIASNSRLAAATLELDETLVTGGDARIGGDLYIDGALNAASLFVPNGLTIDGGLVMNGLLDASEIRVSSGAVIDGTLTINHSLVMGSGATVDFGSGAVSMERLIVAKSLFVLGDITIEGLARFLGDVEIHGELIVSNKHAGYAMIPKTGTSVTVNFGTGFHATPVVTASPNVPVLYAVSTTTQTGFTLSLAAPASQDIIFGWHALGTDTDQINTMQLSVDDQLIFPIDTKGIPVSTNIAWNACIRNVTLLDETGQPLSCSRYHDGYTWTHPDLMITFLWNTNITPAMLTLPDGYEKMVTEDAATVEASWAHAENATEESEETEESEDSEEFVLSSSSTSSASFASSESSSEESTSEASSSSESSTFMEQSTEAESFSSAHSEESMIILQ